MSKKMKEDILREHFQDALKVGGKKIIIMKEMSRKMVQDRKGYKRLMDKLRQLQIKFRWEIPQGLSFTFKDVKTTISSLEQMVQFLIDNKQDFE